MQKTIFFFIFLLWLVPIYAKKSDRLIKVIYVVKEKTSLNKIYSELLKKNISQKEIKFFKLKTIKINPSIKNWKNLNVDQKFGLVFRKKYINKRKYLKYKKNKSRKDSSDNYLTLSYLSSISTLNQSNTDKTQINFQQISPLTLGLGYNFGLNRELIIESEIYGSYFLGAKDNISDKNTNVPLEVGVESFLKYQNFHGWDLSAGLSYERISYFNSQALETNDEISIDQINLGYITIGASLNSNLSSYDIVTTLYASYGIYSDTISSNDEAETDKIDSSYRLKLSSKIKLTNTMSVISFLSQQSFKNENQVELFRFGAGLEYRFN